MKKLCFWISLLVCTTVLLTGCAITYDYQLTELENVSMRVIDPTATGATLVITDTNEKPFMYGEWYAIQKEVDGEWVDVETVIREYGFNDIAYQPHEGTDTLRLTVDWEWLYGELPAGKYRILKEVDKQFISATFRVNDET